MSLSAMGYMWLRAMDIDSYYALVKPYIDEAVKGEFDKKSIAKVVQQRADTLNEIAPMLGFFDTLPSYDNELYVNKKMKTNPEVALTSLKECRKVLEAQTDWSESALHETLLALPAQLGVKNGIILFPLRLAITGMQFTPGGAIEIANILGKEETLRRLDLSIQQLENA